MPGTFSCPEDKELQSFVQGKHSPAEVDQLADHVEQCSRCAETLEQFLSADTLADTPKDRTWFVESRSNPVVDNLIEKLSALAAASCDTLVRSGDATPSPEGEPAKCLEILAPAEAAGELGRLAAYRVLRVLGHGGMGIVFHAEDTQLRRPVALKVMNPSLAESPLARQRFVREARAAAAVTHDHIVSIYQVGEERGVPFLAMPLLQGESLEERLRRVGKLPVPHALHIGREIAEGLAAAHEHGLIHRDIKPANIFLEAGGDRVKIVDFGLARSANDDARLTQSGTIMGTPAYMAPEQARGEEVEARSDLFSLGCVLYRMCTGNVPFHGPDVMSTLTALALDTPASPREVNLDVPPALSELIVQLLSKNPAQRPASARVAADCIAGIEREQLALRAVAQPAADEQTAVLQPALPPRRRWPGRIAVAALLLVGGGLAANQIVIRIRDREGKETTVEIPTDEGVTASIEVDGKAVAKITSGGKEAGIAHGAAVKPALVKFEREPLPEFAPGAPLGPLALVTAPAPVKGVRSWTIETRGSRSMINSVAYTADSRRLATSGNDGTIRIYEADSGKLVRALIAPNSDCAVVAWSPDGKTLACGCNDMAVRLWDVEAGRLLRTMREHTHIITAVVWSPDGARLATGSQDKTVRLWDAVDGRLRDSLQLHTARVNVLAWSPDGRMVASGSDDKTMRLWDADSGNHLQTVAGFDSAVRALTFSPDSATVVLGGDKGLYFWPNDETRDVGQSVKALAWLADGKTLAVGLADGAARLVDVETGQTVRGVQGQIGDGAELAIAPDGRTVTIGRGDGGLHVWEIRSGKRLVNIAGHKVRTPTWNNSMPPLAWSPNGKMLAYGTLNSRVALWEPASDQLLRSFKPTHAGPIVTLAWSPDSTEIASGGSDNTIRIWDAASGKELRVYVHVGWISALAWSPDGKTIASGGQDNTVRLWESATGRQLHKLEGHKTGVQALAWSPDSQRLISGSFDQTLRIWEAESGKQLHLLDREPNDKPLGENRAAAWSPDGKTIAAGGLGMWLWNAESGEVLQKFTGGGFRNVAFSPDGKSLASGFSSGLAQTWEVNSGKALHTLTGPGGNVDAVTWSPDGKTLACSTANYWTIDQIRVWDASSGQLISLVNLLADSQGLALSPAGHFRGTAGLERELVYVVQTDAGQDSLTPEQFAARFGWKNDRDSVRFTAQ